MPNHLITDDVDDMPAELGKYKDQLQGRTMLVRKAKVVKLEAIVRGYITGARLFLRLRDVREAEVAARWRVVRVPKVRDGAWDRTASWASGIAKAGDAIVYTVDEGGAGRARREYSS